MIGTGRSRFDREERLGSERERGGVNSRRRIKAEEEKVAEELKPASVWQVSHLRFDPAFLRR